MATKTQNSKLKIQNNTSGASSMAELLSSYKKPLPSLQKGEIIEGTITKLTPSEILVDISAKSEAVVLEKDKRILHNLLANLKVGDKVNVSVLNPESDFGYPVVSLRRFIDEKAWKVVEDLQKDHACIEATVEELTKGGYVVSLENGPSGFLPNSYIMHALNPQDMLGKKIKVFILEVNRQIRKVILSQKPVLSEKQFGEAIKNLKMGEKVKATVSNITPFGAFVTLPIANGEVKSLDGLIHISEISWEKVTDVSKSFAQGDQIEAQIVGFDRNAKRVDLSIKRTKEDPFEELTKKYEIEQKVKGTIAKILPSGLLIDLDGVEGFIRKEKIPPTVTYKEGQNIDATVTQIDKSKHRIVLVPVLLEKPIGYR